MLYVGTLVRRTEIQNTVLYRESRKYAFEGDRVITFFDLLFSFLLPFLQVESISATEIVGSSMATRYN